MFVGAAVLFSGVAAVAQGTLGATPKAPAPVLASHLSLSAIYQAPQVQDYTAVQLRRFYTPSAVVGQPPTVTTVRESLISDANGAGAPAYEVTFLGVEGELPGSVLNLQWANTYQKHGRRFHESGSFQIRDLAQAQANYAMHSFSNVVRAGRAATRVVIYPGRLDKSIWVVDIDQQTSLPLYSAEFDRQLRILSEVEVVALTLSAQLPPSPPSQTIVQEFDNFAEAAQQFDGDLGLIDPDLPLMGEYQLRKALVREEPLNQRKTLQLTYTDGVDEFHLVQEMAPTDPFAGLPSQSSTTQSGHTIARYSDHSMRVLLFWAGDVSFQVAGRGSLVRLDEFAREVYSKALLQ
ncbi:MAG: hypothetical protein RL398_3190 [Planctomycetota bacterium]|jgi:hypothetical protein